MKGITKGGCVVWLAIVVGSCRLWSARRSLLGLLVCHGHLPRSLAWAVPVRRIGCLRCSTSSEGSAGASGFPLHYLSQIVSIWLAGGWVDWLAIIPIEFALDKHLFCFVPSFLFPN